MTTIRFHLLSTLTPAEVVRVLTDFGPTRPETWANTIDAAHFVVHERGDTWAEVTEGTAAAWERARYDWDPAGDTVTVTTLDSKLFGAGGGWVFRATPTERGSRVDVELTRTPTAVKGKILAALLPLIGPSSLRKSFAAPLRAA
ncbi:hypothetical protein [Nocardia asteroides]|uniref:Uncharacterized protein n=1 Tax=Nocardia asteroides NBRC 15531 TaxID=1110697 RepID=U5EBW2_NOCAS|nr:hypothetical protein [Nocardia asteroides]TLF69861.1 hypothetical protein FEK33_06240 [Nocardia asteroides NBRC 15531]UGT49365.1 hypothetical protein LT345_01715 [Nocardia asteroides]SFL87941.1 YD repeat-containing protein [Nocardia asteroides]VEG38167.1 Uncharacterised protein [Nocardia asteroides]GAD83958.1 hypothetical protein NCAST_20_05280 [Nocardia asteroides NBRC 15531]